MWIFDAGVYNCLFLPAAPVPHTATFDPYEALVGLSDPAPPAALVLGGESVGATRFSTTPTIEEPRRGLTCVSCRPVFGGVDEAFVSSFTVAAVVQFLSLLYVQHFLYMPHRFILFPSVLNGSSVVSEEFR